VQTKVLNQIKYLNVAGADCRGAFFSTEVKEITQLNEQVDLIPVEKCNWKYFRASGQKRNTMLAVLGYTKSKLHDIDLFYFRYPGAGSLLAIFTKLFGNKTVFEHLSIEEKEIELHAKENPFGLSPSKLLSWLEYTFLPLWRERKYGKIVRRNAKLGICNSNEIAEWQVKVAGGKYPTLIGGDAVEVDSFKLLKLSPIDNVLNLVFLKGASTSAEYNGLERVMNGIKLYNGDIKIKLYILGKNIQYEEQLKNEIGLSDEEVYFIGFKSGLELEEILSKMHIGVSQFGMYKKGLNENSTIKAREYFARGIPFIYGHLDPDLNEESKEFALEFSNDENIVEIQKVVEFGQKILLLPNYGLKMREFAFRNLDYSIKMKQLYNKILK
jgi:hypothetical protein